MEKKESPADRIAIGRLGAPKGVRGDLKVHSYSGESEHFLALKEVELASTGLVERRLRLKVLRVEGEGASLTMAFEGYPSPEAARVLTGMDIMVGPEGIAPLRKNEWYISDLVGLAVVAEGREVGRVLSVLEGGPEPWLEVQRNAEDRMPSASEGSAKRNAAGVSLVPFRKEFVGEVDVAAGRLELIAPWILE
ncbi:MAG TPA: ribosome maturation factor RimM [Rectinemataceae bacterium]|nr:ribosome maturation factor RimM [Rectinemataceae bacterium]